MFSAHALREGCGYERDDLYPLCSKLKFGLPSCVVWLYYASSSTTCMVVSKQFFLLSLGSLLHTNYTPSRKKKKKKKIHGGFRSTWGDNFFMGTQNGSKLEIWPWGILIHTLELKLQPFEVIPWLYREAIHLQCFMRMRYVINGEYPFRTRTYYADDLYSIWSKLEYRLPTCIVWLYYTSSLTMRRFPDNFFLLSVWTP